MRCLSVPIWGLLALAALVPVEACCDDYKPRVGELRGQMDFGFDVAADVDFDWDMRFSFDGDWSDWARISAARDVNIDFDWAGSDAFKTRIDGDMDDDGLDESVRLVAFAEGEPSDPGHVFASWEGDKYSFDEGTCYLLWWQGRRLELLSARCDETAPALHCVMTRDNEASFSCDVCNDNGACMNCGSQQTVAECVSTGEKELPNEPKPSGAEGGSAGATDAAGRAGTREPAGGRPNLAGAGGADANAAGAGGSETGGSQNTDTGGSSGKDAGISVSAEWSLCEEQVDSIRSEARDCDMEEPSDIEALCSERLSNVNACYLAVQMAGLVTSPCSVLEENITCGGLFP